MFATKMWKCYTQSLYYSFRPPVVNWPPEPSIPRPRSVRSPARPAVAPLAIWCSANVKFSMVLEKIAPLTDQLAIVEQSLAGSRAKEAAANAEAKVLDDEVLALQKSFTKVWRPHWFFIKNKENEIFGMRDFMSKVLRHA